MWGPPAEPPGRSLPRPILEQPQAFTRVPSPPFPFPLARSLTRTPHLGLGPRGLPSTAAPISCATARQIGVTAWPRHPQKQGQHRATTHSRQPRLGRPSANLLTLSGSNSQPDVASIRGGTASITSYMPLRRRSPPLSCPVSWPPGRSHGVLPTGGTLGLRIVMRKRRNAIPSWDRVIGLSPGTRANDLASKRRPVAVGRCKHFDPQHVHGIGPWPQKTKFKSLWGVPALTHCHASSTGQSGSFSLPPPPSLTPLPSLMTAGPGLTVAPPRLCLGPGAWVLGRSSTRSIPILVKQPGLSDTVVTNILFHLFGRQGPPPIPPAAWPCTHEAVRVLILDPSFSLPQNLRRVSTSSRFERNRTNICTSSPSPLLFVQSLSAILLVLFLTDTLTCSVPSGPLYPAWSYPAAYATRKTALSGHLHRYDLQASVPGPTSNVLASLIT